MKRFIRNQKWSTLLAIMLPIAMSAQTINVDNGQMTHYPLVKKFGVNVAEKTSYEAFKNNADLLTDLGVAYARIPNCWGIEGAGKLFTSPQVSVSGNVVSYDYNRIDSIVNMLKKNDVLPFFVNGYCPAGMGAAWNSVPDTSNNGLWYQLNNKFGQHWRDKGMNGTYYEVWSGADSSMYLAASTIEDRKKAYGKMMSQAAKAVDTLTLRNQGDKIAGPSLINGKYSEDMKNSILIDGQGKNIFDMWTAQVVGSKDLKDKLTNKTTTGWLSRIDFWDYTAWQTAITSFSSFEMTNVNNTNYVGASQFLEDAKLILKNPMVHQVYVNQFIDGTDGIKGLVAADGKKSALYFALKLYNAMPLDRVKLMGANDLNGFASADLYTSGLMIWNKSGADKSGVKITINNIRFASGKAKLYRIDATHSANGTLESEDLADVNSSSYTTTIDIPKDGVVYLKLTDGTGKLQAIKQKFAKNTYDKYTNWLFPLSDGHAWMQWDQATKTAFVGDTGKVTEWYAHSMAVYVDSLPKKFWVEMDVAGQPTWNDANSALYFRIDFEAIDKFNNNELYWESSALWADTIHSIYDPQHGSQPDQGTGQKEDQFIQVDYTKPFMIDVTKLPIPPSSDWTGGAVMIFYLQNLGKDPWITKYRFFPTEPVGIHEIAKNQAEIKIYPVPASDYIYVSLNKINKNQPVNILITDLAGKQVFNQKYSAGQDLININTSNLSNGMYFATIINGGSVTTKKFTKASK